MNGMIIWFLLAAAVLVALVIAVLLLKERRKTDEADEAGQLIDYDIYIMSKAERRSSIAIAAAAIFAIGYVFYRNPIISLLIIPFALLYPKYKTKEIIRKRKYELNMQFKEALYSLSSSLTAGKSIETAFKEALKDLSIQYPDPNTNMIRELEYIVRKLEMNETVESALQDFADRSHLEDIRNFVNVFQISKRSGGNLVQVIKNSTEILKDKIEIRQEIDTLLAERRFEQKVLNVMPILMIFFISMSARDFMQPVFATIQGNIVMTFAVSLLVSAYLISKKIMDIEV